MTGRSRRPEHPTAKRGRVKSNLLPAVVVAVGLVLGGRFMSAGGAASTEPAEATTTTTEHPGAVVSLCR